MVVSNGNIPSINNKGLGGSAGGHLRAASLSLEASPIIATTPANYLSNEMASMFPAAGSAVTHTPKRTSSSFPSNNNHTSSTAIFNSNATTRPALVSAPTTAPASATPRTTAPSAFTPSRTFPGRASGTGAPVFKNPLDLWGSPPPPSKRQKTEHAENESETTGTSAANIKTSPKFYSSRTQPLQVTGSSSSRTGASSKLSGTKDSKQRVSHPSTPRPLPVPTGFRRTVEDNKVVFIIDDDDGDDGGNTSCPSPLSRPPQLSLWLQPHVKPPASAIVSNPAPEPLKNTPSTTPPPRTVNGPTPPPAISAPHPVQLPHQQPAAQPNQKVPPRQPSTETALSAAPSSKITQNTDPPGVATANNASSAVPPVKNGGIQDGRSRSQTKSSPALSFAPLSHIPKAPTSPSLGVTSASPSTFSFFTTFGSSATKTNSQPGIQPTTPAASYATPVILPKAKQKDKTQTRQAKQTSPLQLQQTFVRFSGLALRPYLRLSHREFVAQNYHGLQNSLKLRQGQSTAVIHVDFLPDEVQHLLVVIRSAYRSTESALEKPVIKHLSPEKELRSLLRKQSSDFFEQVVSSANRVYLPGRTDDDIYAYLADVCNSKHRNRNRTTRPSNTPVALTLSRHERAAYCSHEDQAARAAKLNILFMAREMAGQRIVTGRMRQPINFTNEIRKLREDSLRICNEWTNCAGDITTVSWTSDDAFICGTTTHMDDRNHQYNRQGNLGLASVTSGKLRAYPDHRVVRRQQVTHRNPGRLNHDDPWLYTSVVSSDFAPSLDFAFTSSFDNTVKVWRIDKNGNSMAPMGTWRHDGKVNFVVASSHPVGLIATAADVSEKAVRVYRFLNPQAHGRITYKVFSCSRIVDPEGRPMISNKWAYFPAAVRWGLTDTTMHLLLVGYSPRSLGTTTDDEDIPEDRRNSGELCLWDGLTGARWIINGGRSHNVFEVAWHPSLPCFAAATAANTACIDENIRTQIRIFRPSANPEYEGRAYSEVQTLDCFADDINELALFPNSLSYIYVAAGATNGRTYVWDTSQGDHPIHVLAHGDCIEELAGDKISVDDTGVKFVAWGETQDRLYTGSSDGVVKVWNIRTHCTSSVKPFVRDLLQCPASVSFGAFSPNKSKLVIGDASGRVFLLSVEDDVGKSDEDEDFISDTEEDFDIDNIKTSGISRPRCKQRTFLQHPPEMIRHPTPPPPPPPLPPPSSVLPDGTSGREAENEDSGRVQARKYLESGQLVIDPNRTIGAVKGPHYADTNLFCLDFHYGRQPDAPLLAQYDRVQQENRPRACTAPSRQRPLRSVFHDRTKMFYNRSPDDIDMDDGTTTANGNTAANSNSTSAQKQRIAQWVHMLHQHNKCLDLDVHKLPAETRQEIESVDRSALLHLDDYDYGFAYEEFPADL